MKQISIFLLSFLAFSFALKAQDQGCFQEYKRGYYHNTILKDVRHVEEQQKQEKTHKRFKMDMSGMELPNKKSLYKSYWHQPSVSQGNAGTCWCFSTISFLESEIYRLHKKEVKLSEIYIVYWEYVEKARRFVRQRGESAFNQGAEANSVTRMAGKYGLMPAEAYTGLLNGRKFHTHAEMYEEMNTYLQQLKTSNNWNEELVLSTIKSIMHHHIGEPPVKFEVDGKSYTPMTYMNDYLELNPDDYVEILSYKQQDFWKQVEYEVPDNWWHSDVYYNVPLMDYMAALKSAIRNGYTVSIGGDVSEPGFSTETQCALVPSFDIAPEAINGDARQMRFSNGSTTDDHGMHLVGYMEKDGEDWYLVKDSSSGSRNNAEDAAEFGYYFFHEDYVKLKMMDFTVHKDAVKDLLKKFK